jgi:hypothetical protein
MSMLAVWFSCVNHQPQAEDFEDAVKFRNTTGASGLMAAVRQLETLYPFI